MLIHNKSGNNIQYSSNSSTILTLKSNETRNIENKKAKDLLHRSSDKIEKISYTTYHATDNQCPICFITLKTSYKTKGYDVYSHECLRCGDFSITQEAKDDVQSLNEEKRAYLSHKIKLGLKNITNDIFEKVKNINSENNSPLISSQEQVTNLMSYLFDESKETGHPISLSIFELEGIIGANQIYANSFKKLFNPPVRYQGYGSVYYVLKHLEEKKLVDIQKTNNGAELALTIEGWQYYEKLKASKAEVASDVAFFALQFPKNPKTELDKKLIKFYEECKNRLRQIGIKLNNPLLEEAKNGNISNRLENEIIKAKFIVADLSHNNSGVYWEAGFAHGLNKKVFYTCCKERQGNTHFDVSQHYAISWDDNDIAEAAEELKEAIERSFL